MFNGSIYRVLYLQILHFSLVRQHLQIFFPWVGRLGQILEMSQNKCAYFWVGPLVNILNNESQHSWGEFAFQGNTPAHDAEF